jgi:uncharacterized protein YoxC
MQRIIGTPTPQPLIPTSPVAPTPKAAPAPSPAPTTTPTPAPATAPTTLAKPEATVVEDSIKTSKPSEVSVLSSVVKETGVDITSDIPASSDPATALTKSETMLSQALDDLKEEITQEDIEPTSSKGDETKTTGIPKARTLLKYIFDSSSSLKEKFMSLSFRQHAVNEFSYENTKFMDCLRGVSEMSKGSLAQDQAIEQLFQTHIKEGASEMINIPYKSRKKTTQSYAEFSAAKKAYAQNPSKENLTQLNLARANMLTKLTVINKQLIQLAGDTKERFHSSDLFQDMNAFLEGKFSLSKPKSLGKALYIQEQLDLTMKINFEIVDTFKHFGIKTEKEAKSKMSTLESQIKTLKYGSSTTDKIKHKVGMASQKVLSPEQKAKLQSLVKDLKELHQAMGYIELSVKARSETLEQNFEFLKKAQTQVSDPDFLTQLKSIPQSTEDDED